MAVFKCKMCGGTLEVKAGESVIECSYCGNMNTLPKLDDDRRVSLYDRANHYMQNNEYDKAMSTYEKILEEDKTDAEAYWSIVLCRYGIEYVEDPTSHKRIPTINRMQMTSILADQDYKSALKYADSYQKSVYEQQAKDIADIQKGILEIVNNEEPFDIFICYKETDNNGRRTQDSVLAQELYYGLKNEGFKVFFSRITLEDKLGVAYEPYIFSALKSSKVMVVIGTKPEHFNAVWVKNEWSRYLSLIRNGEKKTIIPAYKDMDPYDIPDELSHLQAQDMSKLGFMQDMIRGIKKVIQTEPEVKVVKEVRAETVGGNANVNSLLKRITIFLEDEDYDKAEEYCQKVLDIDPENSMAYLYLAMCEYNAKDEATLAKNLDNLSENGNIIKAKRYAIDDKQREKIDNVIQANLNAIKQDRYNYALGLLNKKKYEQAKEAFGIDLLQGFKDSAEMVDKCIEEQNSELYNEAMRLYTQKQYSQAVEAFDDARLANYKDSKEMKNTCLEKFYVSAKKHYDKNDFDKAFVCLEVCKRYDYKDAQELIAKYKEEKKEYESNKRTYEMAEYDYKNGREKLALPLYKRLAEKNYLDSVDKVKTIEKKIEKRKKRCKYSIIFVITAVLLTAIIVASIFLGQSIQYSQSGLKITNEAVTQILEADEDGSKTIPIEVGGKKISKIKISRNDTCKASKIIIHSNITSVSISSPSVEEIVLAESWTEINASNFTNCPTIKTITIPSSVNSISLGAFSSMPNLENIIIDKNNSRYSSEGNCIINKTDKTLIFGCGASVIPNDGSVTKIGEQAFANCKNIVNVTIPDRVTSIGAGAFSGCVGLKKVLIKNKTTVIWNNAFDGCTKLTSINIPDNLKTISENTFRNCTSLQNIAIPDSVSRIGNGAFADCQNLKNIIIPNGVNNIGNEAFKNCKLLTNVVIPKSVTNIGEGAFSGCIGLTEISIPFVGNRAGVTSRDTYQYPFGYIFGTAYYNYGVSTEQYYHSGSPISTTSTTYYIPSSLKSVTVTGGEILYGAFNNCSNLINITISDDVTTIGGQAFSGCSSLESMVIPFVGAEAGKTSSDTYQYPFGYLFGTSSYTGGVATQQYYYGSSTSSRTSTTYYIPSSLKSVTVTGGNVLCGAFYNCSSLTSITIPNSVTSIGYRAFDDCSSLTSITIPNSVTSIEDGAFWGCSSITSITIPNSVTSIEDGAFWGCSSITSITIPNSVTSIGDRTFQDCSSLTSVTIPNSVTSIGDSAFEGCSSLTGITIPDSVTSIGISAFYNCSSLTRVDITDIAKWCAISFGSNPLYYAHNLYLKGELVTDLVIPDSVTSIRSSAFSSCSSLISVNMLVGLTSIEDDAFRNCSNLTSITIPNSVTSIGEGAFFGCSSLESMTIPFVGAEAGKTSSDTYQYPFGYIFGMTSYAGGEATKQYYYGSNTSSTTSTTYYIPSSLKSVTVMGGNILYGAFKNCSNLTSIIISDSVTSIGSSAFSGCTSLTNLIIGNGVTNISSGLLSGCGKLERITIPFVGAVPGKTSDDTYQYPFGYIFGTSSYVGGVATEQYYYGSNTSSKTSTIYYIPSSLRSVTVTGGNILYGAFSGCGSLTGVTIGNGVTSVKSYAFSGCSSLTRVDITDIAKWCAINFDSNPLYYAHNLYLNGKLVTDLVIPDSVTSIGDGAFFGCSSLTSIKIPNSVTSIGSSAFSGCSSLRSIKIPNSVTSIGYNAFSGCSSLESMVIPFVGAEAGKTSSDTYQYPFGYIFGMTSYTGGVATRQSYYESSTSSPTSTTYYIPSSLKSVTVTGGNILHGAFYGCSSLTTITIPDSVTSIGDWSFSHCSNLMTVTIPNSVTSIGYYAFNVCSSLTSIKFQGTKSKWNAISKGGTWNNATGSYTIYCTDGDISK